MKMVCYQKLKEKLNQQQQNVLTITRTTKSCEQEKNVHFKKITIAKKNFKEPTEKDFYQSSWQQFTKQFQAKFALQDKTDYACSIVNSLIFCIQCKTYEAITKMTRLAFFL